MIYEQDAVRRLYKRLLAFYPRSFREQLAESMEQTFNDLWMEKRRAKEELFGFVLWTFVETSIGIFREHLLLISPGDLMQTILKTIGSPALISLLLILPFMIMEVVNRRNFDEDFPFFLFFFMWLNLFAISLILLPIVRSRRTANQDMANPIPRQRNIPFTNPKSAAMLSISLILSFVLVFLLDYVGWVPLNYLVNGPNPEQPYLPGLFISLALFSIPVAAAIVACRPIVSTLQTGGSLFAHPIHLIIVVVILTLLAFSWGSWVIDQWPCFMGVPNCD
jgi:magnesium-transporting ATPase (P-type)